MVRIPYAALETDAVAGRARRARSLAAFFAAGGGLSATMLLVTSTVDAPGWGGLHRWGIGATVVAAVAVAVALHRFAELVGAACCHLLTASGTVLIGACQALAGGGSATAVYGLLYILVALHAAMYFSRQVVAAQLAFTAVTHGAALHLVGEGAAIAPQVIVTVGTQLVAALVVGAQARELRIRADTDPLTGLGNRRRAHARLARELERSRREPSRATCLAVLDLDGFERLNDERGRVAGDLVLVEVATAWRSLLRGDDVLTRTGGDEFTLILADCELEVAAAVVRRLQEHPVAGVTCSAGLAAWDGSEPLHALIRRAEAALGAAKSAGQLVIADDPAGDASDVPV